jgi:cysteinyl-tRNA synthetase
MSGRKMAKSAGNFQRITELAEAGLDPLAFRYLCLGARYGRKLDYSDTSLAAAAAGLESLREAVRRLGPPPVPGPWSAPSAIRAGAAPARPIGVAAGVAGHGLGEDGRPATTITSPTDRAGRPAAPLSAAGQRLHAAFVAAVDHDLDMPAALRITRQAATAPALAVDERRWLVLDVDAVLGLDLDRVWAGEAAAPAALPRDAAPLMAERAAARAQGDFVRADALRAELRALGVEPIDRGDGTSDWRPVEPAVPARTDPDQPATVRSMRSRKRSSSR